MNKFIPIFVIALLVVAVAAVGVSAQMAATMPVLYNSNGTAVNLSGSGALPAGWYHLDGGAGSQVYYYGNGTFYNSVTGLYGGSVMNPNGTAGVALNYVPISGTTYTSPGVPNTGLGGNSTLTWFTLLVAAAIGTAGVVYMTRRVSVR